MSFFSDVLVKMLMYEEFINGIIDKEYYNKLINGIGRKSNLHYITIDDNGQLYGFGSNLYGQLGRKERKYFQYPIKIDVSFNVKKIWVWKNVSLFVNANGELYRCGLKCLKGKIDQAENDELSYIPEKLCFESLRCVIDDGNNNKMESSIDMDNNNWVNDIRIKSIDYGGGDFLMLVDENDVNVYFGRGLKKYFGLKRFVIENDKIKSIACCSNSCICLLESGEIMYFDSKCIKSIFSSTTTDVKPKKIVMKNKIKSIASGNLHYLILCMNGEVYSFGSSKYCGVKHKSVRLKVPRKIKLDCKVSSISCGSIHSLLLCENNEVYAFGNNSKGQLGIEFSNYKKQFAIGFKYKFHSFEGLPKKMTKLSHMKIKSIYSSYCSSIVIYSNGYMKHFGSSDVFKELALFNNFPKFSKMIDNSFINCDDVDQVLKNDHFQFIFDDDSNLFIEIQSSLCIQSPYLKDLISNNIFEKKFEKKFYSCFSIIKGWLKGNIEIPKNTNFNDVNYAVELSRMLMIPHLTFHLCILIE